MKRFIRSILFVVIFIIILFFATQILSPHWFIDSNWPTTNTIKGFYALEDNSLDVVFLGSSACSSSFIPQIIYDEYGISSYNLGFEQQNMVSSFYWLREILKTQTPSVMVLECHYAFESDTNLPDKFFRKAFDDMRFSDVKREAINTVCSISMNQTLLDYYFPIIRFHDRWEELSYKDFWQFYKDNVRLNDLNGYTAFFTKDLDATHNVAPITDLNLHEKASMGEIEKQYLDKIVELCHQNGIKIVLCQIPKGYSVGEQYATLLEYSNNNDCYYVDYNTEDIIDDLQYDYHTYNQSLNHPNFLGAQRITMYMGEFLKDNFNFSYNNNPYYETTRSAYDNVMSDWCLKNTIDIDEYFTILNENKGRYTFAIAVKDEATKSLSFDTVKILRDIGFDLDIENSFQISYIAVYSSNGIYEAKGYSKIGTRGRINDYTTYCIESAGYNCGNMCSIKINDKECSKGKRGMNIVVYDTITNRVIDTVAFDTYSDCKAYR